MALPDGAFEHDGQLTKRDIRAVTLARLAPAPDELLWDIGAGSGSVAIEWMRTSPGCRAVAVESHPDRAARIERNAASLDTPTLQVIKGKAPQALADLARPDAVFIGGGTTTPTLIDTCWTSLLPGGRLVANTVTLEGQQALIEARDRLGGDLVQIAVSHATPIGTYTTWRPALPVTQWTVLKDAGTGQAIRGVSP